MKLNYLLVLGFSCIFITSSIAQHRKNALRTDPVLGLIQGNITIGYERYFSPTFSIILTFHHLEQSKTAFASLPGGSYTTNSYKHKGYRFSLAFRNYFSLTSKQQQSFFFSPILFTGQHEIEYANKISSGLGTISPRSDSFFREEGRASTTVNSSGLAFYLGKKWKGDFGEFIEIMAGAGYRYTAEPWRPITYQRLDRSLRTDEFRLRNDVNGLFSRVSLVFGIEF